ncbi:MAG: carboxylating nicotinate-nucleotide diphosphorylase [Myxococcota bacterium]
MSGSLDASARRLIALALEEDVGPGDVTSVLVAPDALGAAVFRAREPMVLAGTEAVREVFRQLDPAVQVDFHQGDGQRAVAAQVLGHLQGPVRGMLTGERTALNLLQRLSGIASAARRAQDAVGPHPTQIVDTRKTTPGLRSLEKAAVRAGGAANHRVGLFDGVLIKDNHIAALGGVKAAVERARAEIHHLLRIEVECDDLDQVDEAVAAGADVILLDNMSDETMSEALGRINGRALTEASGGISLERIPSIAALGVNFISMGALTQSAPAVDIGLDWDG